MATDLRDQLAHHLFDIVYAARHRPLAPGTLYSEAQFTEYKDLADECLRQMEWARTETCAENEAALSTFGLAASVPPLTLAPEGWTP